MVMQTDLADYAHKFENLLDRVRSGEIICTPEMATLLLDALDGLNSFMDRIRGTGDLNQELIDRTLKQIGVFESGETPAASVSDQQKSEQKPQQDRASAEVSVLEQEKGALKSEEQSVWDDEEEDEKGYLLNLKFSSEMLRKGSDPLLLINGGQPDTKVSRRSDRFQASLESQFTSAMGSLE